MKNPEYHLREAERLLDKAESGYDAIYNPSPSFTLERAKTHALIGIFSLLSQRDGS